MALILGVALMPAIIEGFNDLRDGTFSFNCATAPEYNATAETNTLGCTVTGIGPAFFLLAIIFGGISYVLYGGRSEPGYQ